MTKSDQPVISQTKRGVGFLNVLKSKYRSLFSSYLSMVPSHSTVGDSLLYWKLPNLLKVQSEQLPSRRTLLPIKVMYMPGEDVTWKVEYFTPMCVSYIMPISDIDGTCHKEFTVENWHSIIMRSSQIDIPKKHNC